MKTRTASTIQEEPIEWLWPRRIPLGCLTILEGDADVGKSRFMMELAARVSCGDPVPDGPSRFPAGTVLVANDEDPDDTITKPRLVASGANLENIEVFDLDDPTDPFRIPTSVAALATKVDQLNKRPGAPPVRLITIDPLNAFWSKEVNPYNDPSVRQALRPFNRLARMFNLGVVALRHLTKGSDGNAKHRGQGSVAIGAFSRSCMLVALDPANRKKTLILPVKGNWDEKPPGWSFSQETYTYVAPSGRNIKTSKLLWGGPTRQTADDLSRVDPNPPSTPEMEEAERFLRAQLAGGPVSDQVLRKKAGPLANAVWRQAYAMEIIKRHNGNGKGCTWELKEQPNENSNCSDLDFTNA